MLKCKFCKRKEYIEDVQTEIANEIDQEWLDAIADLPSELKKTIQETVNERRNNNV